MPVYQLDERIVFPMPELAEEDGLLAVGGDLRPERLLLGYAHGIFPWYNEGLPILWHSPDPRMVLPIDALQIPRSTRKALRRGELTVRLDTAFDEVIDSCARVPRPGQQGTWITSEMLDAYRELHRLGFAHSAEAWREEELVGGLYGGKTYLDYSRIRASYITALARQLASCCSEVWNMYGPTETTIWSTCWRVPADNSPIRIGTPIGSMGHTVAPLRPCPPDLQ